MVYSRVIQSKQNVDQNDSFDEDVDDLIFLVSELNQNEDLNVKLNNHSKICKILHNNDEQPKTGGQPSAAADVKGLIRQSEIDAKFKEIMKKCKDDLEQILEEREKAIEEFLEQYAEEKFRET